MRWFVAIVVMLVGGGVAGGTARVPRVAPVVAAYFADWDAGYDAADVPAAKLTDLIYAFGTIDARGRCALGDPYGDLEEPLAGGLRGNFAALRELEARYPRLETEISIGGAGGSARFSQVAASASSRAAFARSCINLFLRRYPGLFDGIDIDWEFPVAGGLPGVPAKPADRADATALLAELRSQLDALGASEHRHYLLTVAMPAGREIGGLGYTPETSWDLAAVAPIVDWMDVMTYDMTTGASPVTDFEAPLERPPGDPTPPPIAQQNNIAAVVAYYESNGVPASEIVLGNAFYGHAFTHVPPVGHGLFQRFRALGADPSYAQIVADYLPRYRRYWDAPAQEPWLYARSTHTFVSYEDPRSLAAKARFILAQHLRGAMVWEISLDDASHDLFDSLAGPILASASNMR